MVREVPLNESDELLEELSYPTDTATVRERFDDVVFLYADGEEALPAVLDRVGTDSFASADELSMELYSVLPVEAVGEPGQSEGEG